MNSRFDEMGATRHRSWELWFFNDPDSKVITMQVVDGHHGGSGTRTDTAVTTIDLWAMIAGTCASWNDPYRSSLSA